MKIGSSLWACITWRNLFCLAIYLVIFFYLSLFYRDTSLHVVAIIMLSAIPSAFFWFASEAYLMAKAISKEN